MSLDTTAVVDALAGVEGAIGLGQGPTALDWIQAVATTFVLGFTAWAAWSAKLSADAARQAADYDHLHDLRTQFDDSEFFVRMWRLDQLSRGVGFGSVPVPVFQGIRANDKHRELKQSMWAQALASDWNSPRHDMLAIYYFGLRLNAWLRSRQGNEHDIAMSDVAYLNDLFGVHLLGTLLKHDEIACRLKHADGNADYYPRAYGLYDPQYRNVVKLLLDDLTGRARLDPAAQAQYWDSFNKVGAYIVELGGSESAGAPPEQLNDDAVNPHG